MKAKLTKLLLGIVSDKYTDATELYEMLGELYINEWRDKTEVQMLSDINKVSGDLINFLQDD